MIVTLFADASYHQEVAGYAWWYKSSIGKGSGSGSQDRVASICQAELLGILSGVEAAAAFHPAGGTDYVIQCDSAHALGVLMKVAGAKIASTSDIQFGPPRKVSPDQRATAERIRVLAAGGNIWLKHVKGHTGRDDPRHSLNRFVDHAASRARVNHRAAPPPKRS